MSKIYGNKDAKSCTSWSFPSYREDEIHWETCWHVWQICRVINSLNADTATRPDFTEIVPTKFHLWFRSSQFSIYPLVRVAPFLKENQQLPDADARCIGSQTAQPTLKTLYTLSTHNAEPRMHGNIIARNYLENWRRQKRLSDKLENAKSPSFFSRDQLKVSVRTRNAGKSFSEYHSPPPTNPRYNQETFFRILYFSF